MNLRVQLSRPRRAAVRLGPATVAICGWFGQGACAPAHRFAPQGKLDLALPYCGIRTNVTADSPSPIIRNWLVNSGKNKLSLPVAPLKRATCGDIELKTAAAREVARLARAHGSIIPKSALEAFHQSYGVPFTQAKSAVKAYYRERFAVDYHLDDADVSFGFRQPAESYRGPQPILKIHVRGKQGAVQVVDWVDGVFRKRREYEQKSAPPDYLRTCMPTSSKWIPGEVVGLLKADSDGLYRLWLTGEGHHVVAVHPGEPKPGRGNLRSTRPCQFLGADGHRFSGRMSWNYRAVTKLLRRNVPNPFWFDETSLSGQSNDQRRGRRLPH